jgi:TM2 domain-containing membrane protein YozV
MFAYKDASLYNYWYHIENTQETMMTQNVQPPIEEPPMNEPPMPPPPAPAPKDPNTAFIIELVGGFFGLLGLGYMYMGRTDEGIIRLIAWIIYTIIAWIAIVLLSTIAIGCLCVPVQIIIQVGVPIWSAMTLKNSLIEDSMGEF